MSGPIDEQKTKVAMSGKFCYSRIALNKLKCRIRLKMAAKTKSGPGLWQD